MADPNFQFNPTTGHNDTTQFPTNPSKDTVRGLLQKLHDQTRDFINNTLVPWVSGTYATKAELQNVVTGGIADGSVTDVKLSGTTGQIKDRFNTHLADIASTTAGKGADIIGVPDAEGHFTADNVGGVLHELFTSVSNGKNQVGAAITDVDPNVTVPTNPTFNDLSAAIGQINTGRRWASSTGAASTNSIRGLAFQPKIIIIHATNSTQRYQLTYISELKNNSIFSSMLEKAFSDKTSPSLTNVVGWTIYQDGFSFTVSGSSTYFDEPWDWLAIE